MYDKGQWHYFTPICVVITKKKKQQRNIKQKQPLWHLCTELLLVFVILLAQGLGNLRHYNVHFCNGQRIRSNFQVNFASIFPIKLVHMESLRISSLLKKKRDAVEKNHELSIIKSVVENEWSILVSRVIMIDICHLLYNN